MAQPTTSATDVICVIHAGLVEYHSALATQRAIHSEISQSNAANTLMLLEHPSVYTAGRRTLDSEKPMDGTPVIVAYFNPIAFTDSPTLRGSTPKQFVKSTS